MSSTMPQLIPCLDVTDAQFDIVIVITDDTSKLVGNLQVLREPIESYGRLDNSYKKNPVVVATSAVPSGRVVFSPTGPLNRDQDDVRRFADAALAGIKKAVAAGCKRPLIVRPVDESFPKAGMVTSLGALQALYVPLECREAGTLPRVEAMGIWCNDQSRVTKGIETLNALEKGRIVTRDIGGSDPERMAAPRVEEYLSNEFNFSGSPVRMEVISDVERLNRDFPLLGAVNRAAHVIPRHRARLIFLEYEGEGPITKTLFLVGKGITYDTGGADIKAGGVMAGMHRDKCGAATVAGIFKVLAEMKPAGVKVIGGLSMVRNSVGEDSYVADEIITSRAGVRVRVGNTDAEGRMVMADVLCRMKELAQDAVNPHLFTIATLTGHAIRAMGPDYSIVMDNGPARKSSNAQGLQATGDIYGDPFEISTIRRDDYIAHTGKSEYEDVLQANNLPSTLTARGHQNPSAFLIMASGLDKYGNDSTKPLAYSHLDIAGSSGPFPGVPTACPLVAFSAHYFMK